MSNQQLYLHCGSTPATMEDVQRVKTPRHTATHFPMEHTSFIDLVRNSLERNQYGVKNEAYGLSKEGANLFGLFQVEHPDQNNGNYANVVGFRNSHDKSYSAGLVAGSRVFVCDNLAFSGEVKVEHKHTKHIGEVLPIRMEQMMLQLGDHWKYQEIRYQAYADTDIEQAEVDQTVGEAIRANALPGSHARRVFHEYENPKHEEFESPNAWSLFNAFTEVAKKTPSALPTRTMAYHGIFDNLCSTRLTQLTTTDTNQLSLDL